MTTRHPATLRHLLAAIVAFLTVAASGGIDLYGQGSVDDGPDHHTFGPPLRNNVLFSYIRTERVRTEVLDDKGNVRDSSERVLTYFITQRQRPARQGAGAVDIEANIDSMLLSYRGPAGSIEFNTQNLDHVSDVSLVRHPAVLVPSALVNSVAHLTISPYGSLVGVRSEAIASLREQAESPHLDDFTYKRLDHMLDDRYLTTVLFPWGNVVPLGREVPYDREMTIPLVTAVDRILIEDSVEVEVVPGFEEARKPILTFGAEFSGPPILEWITYDDQTAPILLKKVDGRMSGRFELDQDGVVLSGVSTATALAEGSSRGRPVNVRIRHEIFVELDGMTAFDVARDRDESL